MFFVLFIVHVLLLKWKGRGFYEQQAEALSMGSIKDISSHILSRRYGITAPYTGCSGTNCKIEIYINYIPLVSSVSFNVFQCYLIRNLNCLIFRKHLKYSLYVHIADIIWGIEVIRDNSIIRKFEDDGQSKRCRSFRL